MCQRFHKHYRDTSFPVVLMPGIGCVQKMQEVEACCLILQKFFNFYLTLVIHDPRYSQLFG